MTGKIVKLNLAHPEFGEAGGAIRVPGWECRLRFEAPDLVGMSLADVTVGREVDFDVLDGAAVRVRLAKGGPG